ADGAGSLDLWAAPAAMSGFGPPALLAGGTMQAPLATASVDRHPTLSGDATLLLFASDRSSAPPRGPRFALYRASRAAAADPFRPVAVLPGLDPLGDFGSPSLALPPGGQAGALFAVNLAVPSRSQALVARVDASGTPAGPQAVLAGVDLAGGAALAV